MRKWKCLIVDDEPPAVKVLQNYAGALEYLEIAGTCNNAFQAIEMLNNEQFDLVFLDISMPQLSGIQLLKTLKHPPRVIFTTAHKDYAIDAFELDAVDYLLKPVSFERFLKAVNKCCHINPAEADQNGNAPEFMYFRADRKMVKVFLDEITFIESFRDYVVIHRQGAEALKVKYAISSVENMLPQNQFLRIHRSYIVSIKKVTAFTNNDVEIGKTELPISRSYPEVFRKLTNGSSFLPDPGNEINMLPVREL
ncbi:response regulator transcription factor [bacterium]|nr:response regulator transcription factor [bacterium]